MDFIEAANTALEKRARAFEARKAVLEDAALTDADKRSRVEAIDVDMSGLEKEARGHIEAAEKEVEHRALNERASNLASLRHKTPETDTRDLAQEFRDLARGKREAVDIDMRSGEVRTATSGTASNAGNTKQTTFVAEVQEAMRFRSDFFNYARFITTNGGETMEWPVKNGMNPTPLKVSGVGPQAENVAYTKGDQSWTKTNLGAYKYGVIVEATTEIVDDSELPILSILASDAGESVADVVMTDLLTGNGTNKPWGWITRSSGAVNAASLSAITFDNMIDLQYSLTPPYRRTGIYMVSDLALPVLRKLKDTQNRYLWEPSTQVGQPDTILGKPVLTDPNIASSGAGAKVAVYGDPKKYLIRQVKTLRVVRSDEYGYDRDVVAFKVTWRGSGDLIDTNSVKALTVTA